MWWRPVCAHSQERSEEKVSGNEKQTYNTPFKLNTIIPNTTCDIYVKQTTLGAAHSTFWNCQSTSYLPRNLFSNHGNHMSVIKCTLCLIKQAGYFTKNEQSRIDQQYKRL